MIIQDLDIKLDTGHVERGNMRLDEIGISLQKDIDFDLVEDALVFMRNNPMFYRKDYYPTVAKMADMHRGGSSYDPDSILSPMVTRGINSYCKEYKLANMPDDIFHEDHRRRLLNKIREEELKQIEKGDYT